MRKIIYYIAASLDGFIAGPNDDISGFVQQGDGVAQYQKDLQDFDTVIMGRKTYEFGYQYGLQAGQAAYPNMEHYIFSETLHFDSKSDQVHICPLNLGNVQQLKEDKGTDIYLCGGGEFAGWLLEHQLIDVLKIKLNPCLLGDGVRLFGASKKSYQLELTEHLTYENDLQIINYEILY